MARVCAKRETCGLWICFVLMTFCARISLSARSEQEVRERFYGNLVNSSAPDSGEGSIAKMFDRVLEKEFSDNDQPEGLSFSLSLCGNALSIDFF